MGILQKIQTEQTSWVKHNFPNRQSWMPLLGLQEEIGELSHHFLKREQAIRTSEDHDAEIRDAVGDIVIFLMDFCSAENIDLETALVETWEKVSKRDWKENPQTG